MVALLLRCNAVADVRPQAMHSPATIVLAAVAAALFPNGANSFVDVFATSALRRWECGARPCYSNLPRSSGRSRCLLMATGGKKKRRRKEGSSASPPTASAERTPNVKPKPEATPGEGSGDSTGGPAVKSLLEGDKNIERLFDDDWSGMPANDGMQKSNVSSADTKAAVNQLQQSCTAYGCIATRPTSGGLQSRFGSAARRAHGACTGSGAANGAQEGMLAAKESGRAPSMHVACAERLEMTFP